MSCLSSPNAPFRSFAKPCPMVTPPYPRRAACHEPCVGAARCSKDRKKREKRRGEERGGAHADNPFAHLLSRSTHVVRSAIYSDSTRALRRRCFMNCSAPTMSASNSTIVLSGFDGSAGDAVCSRYMSSLLAEIQRRIPSEYVE